MMDGVVRDDTFYFVIVIPARVHVPIKTREVVARHFNPNSMTGLEVVARVIGWSVTLYTVPASSQATGLSYPFRKNLLFSFDRLQGTHFRLGCYGSHFDSVFSVAFVTVSRPAAITPNASKLPRRAILLC